MFFSRHEAVEPEKNPVIRLRAKTVFRSRRRSTARNSLTRCNGRLALTPLALVLLLVETTDLIFAVDSVPAVFAVTQKAFIVFTSNVFAILGLRSLYFRAGRRDRIFPASEIRPGRRAGVRRRENAA